MTDEKSEKWKQGYREWLITFVSKDQPYTDSAMDELKTLTNEFVDSIEDPISPDFEVYDYIDFLNDRMTDTNKQQFWLIKADEENSDEFYDRYLETQISLIIQRAFMKGPSDEL